MNISHFSLRILIPISIWAALGSQTAIAIDEREKLPSTHIFDKGFSSEDLTPDELKLLNQNQSEFKELNDSWGWPAWDHKGKFEDRLHGVNHVYYALTPYTDILFRFLAKKFNNSATYLKSDFSEKLRLVLTGQIQNASKTALVAFLVSYLRDGHNQALLTKLANLPIDAHNSLYFIVAILSSRSILFLSESRFDEAFAAIKRAQEIWDKYQEQADEDDDGDEHED